MIYTVTFNPSLDYYLKVNNLKSGAVNKAAAERLCVGGKGINVSLELKELGEKTEALGFLAGFTGEAVRERVRELGLDGQFIEVEGRTRINVKIMSISETAINCPGALIKTDDFDKLTQILNDKLQAGDWLILAGSASCELGDKTYARLIGSLKATDGVKIVVDACGKLLTETLHLSPFLIKPNLIELSEIFKITPPTDTKVIAGYARELQKLGAKNVIVSLGSRGAVMVTENKQAIFVKAAQGQLINSVGAGDCMIAGFIHEYIRTGSYFKALNYATAAGSACAFTENLATKEQIEYIESLML